MARALTTGQPWRVIVAFSVPLLIGNVVQQAYQIADAAVVGRSLGVTSLAAVGATGSFIFLLLGFAWGMTSGFAIPTAQAFGAGDARAVRRSVAAGTFLSAAASVVITAVAPLLAEPMLNLLGTPAELVSEARTFAVVSFLGAATMMFFNFLAAILRAIGDSRTPLYFLVLSCVLNIGLVLLAVPVLEMGVGGAALATVISQGCAALACFWHVHHNVPTLHVNREDWRVTRAELLEHLRLGLPMGFQMSIIAIGMIAIQVRLNELGPDAVAAYTTAARVDNVPLAFLGSMGIATSMFAAQNLGARRTDRIRTGVPQALAVTCAGSVVVGLLVATQGTTLVRLFVGAGENDVVSMAAYFLLVNGSLYAVLLAPLFVLRGALQGLGYASIPTITGTLELGCRVLAAAVLGAIWGFDGVVWGNPLAWLAALAVLIPAYLHAHRRLDGLRSRVTTEQPQPDVPASPEPVTAEPVTAEATGNEPTGDEPVAADLPSPRSDHDGVAPAREPVTA